MGEKKTNPVAWCLPSLTDVAFIMPILMIFLRLGGTKHLLGDGDTGWHIRTGDWILQNGRVPDRDIFSFTKPGEPWFAWEWLWDVVFAWLHRHWGMAAVVLASIFVICVTSALLYRLTRRKCPNVLIAIAVVFLADAASTIHWLARPHLFTLLFLVIFYSMLERVRDGNTKLLWFLPPLTVLWTNLHGGFFVGIVLIGLYGAGELASWLLEADADTRRAALKRSKPYLLAAAACGAASFVNPYFYRLHVHIFEYLTDSYHFKNISEFQSLDFHHPVALYLEPMLALGIAAAVLHFYRRRFTYVLILGGFAHLALMSARNIPLYVLVAAPLVAAAVNDVLALAQNSRVSAWVKGAASAFRSFGAEVAENDVRGRIPLASAAAGVVLIAMFQAAGRAELFKAEYDPDRYPAKAVEVLRDPEFARGVFTHDEWGDYLIYRLYPETKVFVDGRSDFYGAEFNNQYINLMDVKYDWNHILDRNQVSAVLLPVKSALASTLKESRVWRPIYDDGLAIVFRRRDSMAVHQPAPEQTQRLSAVTGGGLPAIARSSNLLTSVAQGSRYARR